MLGGHDVSSLLGGCGVGMRAFSVPLQRRHTAVTCRS
jgi:hypothetical protein